MKKVLIVGAGAQGGPCAAILAGEPGIEEVRLGDINLELAQRGAERIGSQIVKPIKLDASKKDELVKAAEGVDMVMNFTLIRFNENVMESALEVGAHYVDTACNTPFLQRWISGQEPQFHQDFKAKGITALVGCGFAPGVANVLTRYACDRMDKVERIMIRVARGQGKVEQDVVSAWKPTWSPEILLEDYAEPPVVFQDGKFVEVPIFSNPEDYTFPEPVGEVLISSHSHEETYMIPGFYVDKGLKELDFKYPVDKLVGAFIKMGFASDQAVEVNGAQVVPRDVLMKVVERPGNKFFAEDEQTILQSDLTGIMDVTVDGEVDGERLTHRLSYKFTDGPNKERQKQLYAAYGTTLVYVALPAVAGARMCAAGEVEAGVVSPDSLNPEAFFAGMAARGVPFRFDEQITKGTVVGD